MIYREKINNKVRYIVRLKDDFKMSETTIRHTFCAFITSISNCHIYFRLHGSNAVVIVPYDKIDWMAPSQKLWECGYIEEEL
jgi:hypothetical protein